MPTKPEQGNANDKKIDDAAPQNSTQTGTSAGANEQVDTSLKDTIETVKDVVEHVVEHGIPATPAAVVTAGLFYVGNVGGGEDRFPPQLPASDSNGSDSSSSDSSCCIA